MFICKIEKGNGVVVINKNDYSKKLYIIVKNKTRFQEIDYNINY